MYGLSSEKSSQVLVPIFARGLADTRRGFEEMTVH
jgi:hypothetical protein